MKKNIQTKQIIIGVSIVLGGIIVYKVVSSQMKKAKINKAVEEDVSENNTSSSTFNRELPTAFERWRCNSYLGKMTNPELCERVKNNPVP